MTRASAGTTGPFAAAIFKVDFFIMMIFACLLLDFLSLRHSDNDEDRNKNNNNIDNKITKIAL